MHNSFTAIQKVALADQSVSVVHVNGDMTICTPEGPIFITKEQVMDFFGLVEPKPVRPYWS